MKMVFYRTQHATLRQYMEGYYFIDEDAASDRIRYKTFPNNYTILSVSRCADVLHEANVITVVPSPDKEIATNIVFRYTAPITVEYAAAVDEITFYFKPLGINNFIPESGLLSQHNSLTDFHVFPDFNPAMLEIFRMDNREQQITAIENYWLSKLQAKDFALMKNILHEIETSDLKIDEIAGKFNFSRQYINKLFLKHIGKSPVEYRKIHRFRNAIRQAKGVKNLKELTLDNLFYDQSHFNKDFKELTDSSPTAFFKNVDTEKDNIWLFI